MSDTDDQLKKYVLVEAVRTSGLLPSDRLLLMIFIDLLELYGDGTFWFVPEHRTPSFTELTEWSGLGRTTVGKRLNHLEGLGWIKRSRPATADALGRHERTVYWLAIGESEEREKPKRPGRGRYAETGAAAELVQPLHEDKQPDNTAEPVQPLHDPSATAAPDPVQPLHDPSAAAAHNNQPPTGVGSTQVPHQTQPPQAAPAAAAAAPSLPGFEDNDSPPPSKRKRSKAKTPTAPKPPTEGQRVNALAKRYTDVVRLANFQGVRGVVQSAVRCGDYTDEQIGAALDRLALPENRGRIAVTANALRIEIESRGRRTTPARTAAYQDPADTAGYYEEL